MSSRRRRYPKRSEVEGPPPNYGAVEESEDSEVNTDSSDSLEESEESEDVNQKDGIKLSRECKVVLPCLRVERGGSEDVAIPRQATQVICVKMQVGGKHSKEKVVKMFKEKKLSEPAEIRCSGVQTLLRFDTLRAAVKVMEVFDSKFLSNKQNMNYVKKSHKLVKTDSGQSGNNSRKLKREVVFIYFELKSLNKLSLIQIQIKSQKKSKLWSDSPHPTLLSSMLSYLKSICKDTNLTTVFVCSRSAQIFHRLLQAHQPGDYFSGWTDLTSCVRQQLDKNDMKASCYDPDKLSQLAGQEVTTGTETAAMEKVYSWLKTVETHSWQVKEGKYITMVLSIDLLNMEGQAPVVATISMHSARGVSWSTSVTPDTAVDVAAGAGEAARGGVEYLETEKKWVYKTEGEETRDCLSRKDAAHEVLSFMEKQVEDGDWQGVVLVTVLDDLTLAYLLLLMKSQGLVQKFKKLVCGISTLETVWKVKKDQQFDLVQLETYNSETVCCEKTKMLSSVGVARVGYKVLLDMMDNNLDQDNFVARYVVPLLSEKLNLILETAVNILDMNEFDETVFDIIVATQLSVEAGRLAFITLQLSPYMEWVVGCQFSIKSTQPRLALQSDVQTTKSKGKITMTITNTSTTRVKLVVGSKFGLARLLPDIDMEGLGDVTKIKYKPKKRKDLKNFDHYDSSDDEDVDSAKERKVSSRRPGPACSKTTRSGRSKVKVLSSDQEADAGVTKIKVDGHEDVVAITSLEEYRKKVKDDETEGEIIESGKDVMLKDGFLGTGSSTPEILKALGGNDFMKELKESLDKSAHPTELDIEGGWENLSPSLEGFDLDASLEDISENPLSSLEAAAETLEEDGSLKEPVLLNDGPSKISNIYQSVAESPVLLESSKSSYLELEHEKELELLAADSTPFKMTSRVSKKRGLVPVSPSQPLVPQLVSIFNQISSTSVQDDLSDQFPSLLGQEMFTPLCTTLAKYGGGTKQELDFDLCDFGDKLLCEVQGFVLDDLEDIYKVIQEIHQKFPVADLGKWKEEFCAKFESLSGINDLIGENFDIKAIQFLLLHFVDKLGAESSANKVRDMIGFDAYEGYEVVEEIVDGASIIESSLGQSTIDTDKSSEIPLTSQSPDVVISLPVDLIEETIVPTDVVLSDVEEELLENKKDEEIVSVESQIERISVDAENYPSVFKPEEELSLTIAVAISEQIMEDVDEVTAPSEAVESIPSDICVEPEERVKPEQVTQAVDTQPGPSQIVQVPSFPVDKPCEDKIPHNGSVEQEPKAKNCPVEDITIVIDDISVLPVDASPTISLSKAVDSEVSKADLLKKEPVFSPDIVEIAPIDPDEDFSDIYLGVKDEFVEGKCKVMALRGEDPFFASFSTQNLVLNGQRVPAGKNLQELLQHNGEDDDLILIYISTLLPMSDLVFSACDLAIPLSTWADGKFFFDGFVLYHQPQDKCCVAFLEGDMLKTAIVSKDRIKKFDTVLNMTCLEPGLEVKLMVQKRSTSKTADQRTCVNYRASLCIPNPDKRFYDILETTHWSRKTRNHLTDEDTLADIIESLNNMASIHVVGEGSRSFLMIKAASKKISVQAMKVVVETKTTFEKLPGMKPKIDPKLEIVMEFLPENLHASVDVLEELRHVSHYTGTTVQLVDGEVMIEGYQEVMVNLAKEALTYNLTKPVNSLVVDKVACRPAQSTTVTEPVVTVSKPTEDDTNVSSTTEFINLEEGDDIDEPIIVEKAVSTEPSSTEPMSSDFMFPETSSIDQIVSAEVEIAVVPEVQQTTEEDALRGLFNSGSKPQENKDELEELQKYMLVEDPENPNRQPEFIELKIGKEMLIQPNDTRSFSISLKQKLTERYINHIHFDFEWSRQKIDMVTEILSGTSVQVDLRNISGYPVQIKAEQNILLLEKKKVTQKLQASNVSSKRSISRSKSPTISGSVSSSRSTSPTGSKSKGQSGKSKSKPKPAFSITVEKSVTKLKAKVGDTVVFNIRLEKSLSIIAKSVAFVDAIVENADELIFNQVHEIRRHPLFKNSAIFVPDKQKKKINPDGRLKMSLRNRIELVQELGKGKLIGQIWIILDEQNISKSSEPVTAAKVSTSKQDSRKRQSEEDRFEEPSKKKQEVDEETEDSKSYHQFHSITDNLMAWQVGNVERAKLKNQGLLLDDSSSDSFSSFAMSVIDDKAYKGVKAPTESTETKEGTEKPPNKGYILKLLQQSISENVAKSNKKQPPFAPKGKPNPTQTQKTNIQSAAATPSTSQNQQKKLQSHQTEQCLHPPLKEQVCKDALASAGNCKIKNCQTNLQHSFPKQFIRKLEAEFCLRYLNTKVCEKNFPPHFCPNNQHCYDAGPLVKFYRDYYNRVIKKCKICNPKGAGTKKTDTKEASFKKSVEIKNTQNISSRTEFLRIKAQEMKKAKIAQIKEDSTVEKTEQSETPVKLKEDLQVKGNAVKDALSDTFSGKVPSVVDQVKVVETPQIEAECADNVDQKEVIDSKLQEVANKDVANISTSSDDDITIIGETVIPPEETVLRDRCPHIMFRKTICKFRDVNKCPTKSCPEVHAFPEILKLQFCAAYNRNIQKCEKMTCLPHLNHQELQDRYMMAVQARVLTCNRCIFRCKLFNKSNITYKQAKLCIQDFTGTCEKTEGGIMKCNFVHKEEVGHLDLPKLCQTFARRSFCPDKDKEKDLAHMTYSQYDATFKAAIKQSRGVCKVCHTELEENVTNFDKSIRSKMLLRQDKPLCEPMAKSFSKDEPNPKLLKVEETDLNLKKGHMLSVIIAESVIASDTPAHLGDEGNVDTNKDSAAATKLSIQNAESSKDIQGEGKQETIKDTFAHIVASEPVVTIKEITESKDSKQKVDTVLLGSVQTMAETEGSRILEEKCPLPSVKEVIQDDTKGVNVKKDVQNDASATNVTDTKKDKSKPEPTKDDINVVREVSKAEIKTNIEKANITKKSNEKEVDKKFDNKTTQPSSSTAIPTQSRPSPSKPDQSEPKVKPSPIIPPFSGASSSSTASPDFKGKTNPIQASNPRKRKADCPYFGTAAKCHKGSKCEFYHDMKKVLCREFRMGRCRYGSACRFRHDYTYM